MNSAFLSTFLPTIIFYGLSFLSPNNKVFLGFYVLYGIALYILHKRQWKDVLFFWYIASLPLAAGKKIAFDLVSFREFNLLIFRPYGISADVIVTIGDVCIAIMGLVILKDVFFGKDRKKYRDTTASVLLMYFCTILISTVYGSIRPEISFLHALFVLKPITLYWYIRHHVHERVLWMHTMMIIAAAIWLEFVMSGVQMLKQGPIGSVLELTPDYIPYDMSSDSGQIFRPVGSFYHANTLAHFLLPFLCIMIPFFFVLFPGVSVWFTVTTMTVGFSVLLLTLSRSAWISFFAGFSVYVFLVEKIWNIRLILMEQSKRILKWWIIPVLLVILVFVLPRVVNTLFTFERYGSAETRLLLLQDAALAARENPVFGVGLEMDLFFMYLRSVQRRVTNGVIFFFPEPVHNGYMRLLLQAGIVGIVGFFAALAVVLQMLIRSFRSVKSIQQRHMLSAVAAGITAICINSLMQPLLPNIHDIVLFVAISRAYYKSRA